MKIGLWSTAAASNSSTPPDGWPEGQAPSTVNDCAREMMAGIRTYAQTAQWFDHGMSPTFLNATSFTVPGDQSAYLETGRRLKFYDATTLYGTIVTASASAASTTVVIKNTTNISAQLSSFSIAILSQTSNALPENASFSSITAVNANFTTVTGVFPAGTLMPFAQAAAPTGWTQDVTDNSNNRMLRVVNVAGGGVAGTHSPILNNVVPAHTHNITTGTNSVDHVHTINDPGHTHPFGAASNIANGGVSPSAFNAGNTTNTGSNTTGITLNGASAAHTHSGTTDNGSSATNWQPRYIDMIICSKN